MENKETLSDKINDIDDNWNKTLLVKDVKEKIQNVQRRLKDEKFINKLENPNEDYLEGIKHCIRFMKERIDKIFDEEIGEGLLK